MNNGCLQQEMTTSQRTNDDDIVECCVDAICQRRGRNWSKLLWWNWTPKSAELMVIDDDNDELVKSSPDQMC